MCHEEVIYKTEESGKKKSKTWVEVEILFYLIIKQALEPRIIDPSWCIQNY